MRYTYDRNYAAHYGSRIVTVPDQVADDQKGYDGRTFPAIDSNGSRVRVRLNGESYGLNTPGTGDMIVKSA